MSINLIPSLYRLVPLAAGLSIAEVVSDKRLGIYSKTSELLDLAQTVTACLIGLSLVGSSVTAFVGFGAFLGAHAVCKTLSHRCQYASPYFRRLKNLDICLSSFACIISAFGCSHIIEILKAGSLLDLHQLSALTVCTGFGGGILLRRKLFPTS